MAHAPCQVEKVTSNPDSSASIKTGRPSKNPFSRPATVSLGALPCPGSES
jgi:hypothetical protein